MSESIPPCPQCQAGEIIPIVYGMPDADLVMLDAAGEAVIGGVAIYDYSPEWHCKACSHQWRASETAQDSEGGLNEQEQALLRSQLNDSTSD